ncbi:MAG TPA: hypothetical protein VFZ64_03230 [Nocardioidaceae bacterium]
MYPLNDSTTASYLAHSRMEEAAARAEKTRLTRELRAALRTTDDTSPRPRRRWAWTLRPWSVRPVG